MVAFSAGKLQGLKAPSYDRLSSDPKVGPPLDRIFSVESSLFYRLEERFFAALRMTKQDI